MKMMGYYSYIIELYATLKNYIIEGYLLTQEILMSLNIFKEI